MLKVNNEIKGLLDKECYLSKGVQDESQLEELLELNDFQIDEVIQEEISIFVKYIVVKYDRLEVTTMDERVEEILLNQVMWKKVKISFDGKLYVRIYLFLSIKKSLYF